MKQNWEKYNLQTFLKLKIENVENKGQFFFIEKNGWMWKNTSNDHPISSPWHNQSYSLPYSLWKIQTFQQKWGRANLELHQPNQQQNIAKHQYKHNYNPGLLQLDKTTRIGKSNTNQFPARPENWGMKEDEG
jgi:ABC-type uncharacterized transport system permease subunit